MQKKRLIPLLLIVLLTTLGLVSCESPSPMKPSGLVYGLVGFNQPLNIEFSHLSQL
jgi:hypothetical protein